MKCECGASATIWIANAKRPLRGVKMCQPCAERLLYLSRDWWRAGERLIALYEGRSQLEGLQATG